MELFAVVIRPDSGERILQSHPLLKRLPKKTAEACMPYLPIQKSGSVLDLETTEELGCLIDVPGFFFNWSQWEDKKRHHTMIRLVRFLEKRKISILSFPLISQYLNKDECFFLQDAGIILLDGFYQRLATMILVLMQLLIIMEKEIPLFETGIWGADTIVGQIWVQAMAIRVNRMCIGGSNYRELERLADSILKTTGLSCEITLQPEVCLGDKNITVLADTVDFPDADIRSSFHFHSIPGQVPAIHKGKDYQKTAQGRDGYHIEMGWMTQPKDMEITLPLDPWDELGVLDGIFASLSRIYREDIIKRSFSLEQLSRLHRLYERYPIKLQGFVHEGFPMHFDRFRRDFFGKYGIDKSRKYNYNYRD